jgi:SAM-dependent methyltransferase
MTPGDAAHLACPTCRGALAYAGTSRAGHLDEGALACSGCGERWPVREGLPRLYREADVRGSDRFMRRFYDGLPRLHDPLVRYTLPIFQAGTERALREAYLPRLELGALRPREGRPARILEVGVGTGANLPLLRRHAPPGLPLEIWGLDLSAGMLGVLRRRLAHEGGEGPRLLLGDAHALPFRDGSFDRVFHVGAINGFRDPRAALAEMARVAEPGSPIVVVDEQLSPEGRASLYHRALFRLVTFYDRDPHCPTEQLPAGATDVLAEQASMFFYSLRFRMPRG